MNYNDYQPNEQGTYVQAHVEKNAAYYRQRAREALKGFWWKAILVTLVASILGGVAVGSSFSFNFSFDESLFADEGTTDEGVTDDEIINEDFPAEDGTLEDDEPLLTDEQNAQFTEAMQSGNFGQAMQILTDANPIFTTIFVVFGIVFIVAFLFGLAFEYLLAAPTKVGYQKFFLELIDGNEENIRVSTLFTPFKECYAKSIGLNFVHTLVKSLTMIPFYILTVVGMNKFFTSVFSMAFIDNPSDAAVAAVVSSMFLMVGLMMLGLLVSCIISIPVSYMYSMAHIILADYPSVGVIEAMRLSRQMMKGNKFRLFCLEFSFIGWEFLAACTCGLGSYAVTPYKYAARAAFYHDISGRNTSADVEFPSVNPDDYIIE